MRLLGIESSPSTEAILKFLVHLQKEGDTDFDRIKGTDLLIQTSEKTLWNTLPS